MQMQNLSTQLVPVKVRSVEQAIMLAERTGKSIMEAEVAKTNAAASFASPTSRELIVAECMWKMEAKMAENLNALEIKHTALMKRMAFIDSVYSKLSGRGGHVQAN